MTMMNVEAMDPQMLADTCADHLIRGDKASAGLGIQMVSVKPGCAEMCMEVREDMLNGHNSCHGGFIFALSDSAFAFACNNRNAVSVASGCTIDFVRPVRVGEVLTAVAQERHLAGRTGVYDVTVSNESGEDVAYFRGKSHRISGSVLPVQETE